MEFPRTFPATGVLLRVRRGNLDWVTSLDPARSLNVISLPPHGWLGVTLTSEHPLVPESDVRSVYHYYFLLRPSGSERFLITSTDLKLIEILLERLELRRSLVPPTIKIHDLVTNLCEKPAVYTLGAVHSRIAGFGQALRKASFYGNDVGEAVLFRELLVRMEGYRVTLRDARKRVDVLGIGERGEVSFAYHGRETLHDVDAALRFISKRGFLDWTENPPPAGDDVGLQ